MRPIVKWSAIGLAGLLAIAAVGAAVMLGASYVEHRRLVALEAERHPPPGTRVDIRASAEAGPGGGSGAGDRASNGASNGADDGGGAGDGDGSGDNRLHVYAEGAGQPTLVFLSGFGTSAPYFDFKPLFEKLSGAYRIAVVERAGYGWSDISDRPRDIDTVLAETRRALRRAGEAPPYVLFPHSMAGLEAIRWAQRHPGEVQAIVGLDPLVPGYAQAASEGAVPSRLITFLARTGLMRSGPDVFATNFPAMVEGRLSPDEAAVAETIFMRRTNTPDMWAEARRLPDNMATVAAGGVPDVPVHAFVAASLPRPWSAAIADHAAATGGEVITLEAGHYLHVERPSLIAEQSAALIEAAAAN